ncbi:transporter [Polaribacter sargassicola]|uniref:transporter n=1 Tax=Polaribacter sargassicola TaxID=2836891 RepID=UPI001F28A47E|nr:transporter [Polaribacter sp. DS7-9]MCG1035577.1 transporter [Polaribacter sp. DS7-9]
MKKLVAKLLFLLILLVNNYIQAQYTGIINSNSPGFSQSPYSVGTGVYQLESNFFYKNLSIEPTFSQPQSIGADLLFRTSFFLEKLELNMQLTYQKDKVAFKNIFTSDYFTMGFSQFTVGAKYLIYEPNYKDKSKEIRSWRKRHAFDFRRFIPSVGVYVGVNTDYVEERYKVQQITPKVGLLLQHSLTNEFNVISNIYYDKIGSDFSEISYIITATQNFTQRWSGFLEHQAIIMENLNKVNYGLGLAYLFNRNLQVNTSGRFVQEGRSQGFYGSLGVSYRLDRHKDSYIELDEYGKEIKEPKISDIRKTKKANKKRKKRKRRKRFLGIF